MFFLNIFWKHEKIWSWKTQFSKGGVKFDPPPLVLKGLIGMYRLPKAMRKWHKKVRRWHWQTWNLKKKISNSNYICHYPHWIQSQWGFHQDSKNFRNAWWNRKKISRGSLKNLHKHICSTKFGEDRARLASKLCSAKLKAEEPWVTFVSQTVQSHDKLS